MKCQFQRCNKRIKDLNTGKVTGFATHNEAKRESTRLQLAAAGRLGSGVLRLVPKIKG